MSKLKRFFDERKLLVLWGIGAVAALSLVIASAVQSENVDSPTQPSVSTEEPQSHETTEQTAMEPEDTAMEFPVSLEDGRLEIDNVLLYDGLNPDCDNQDGRNVASIMLKNVSEEYLEHAKITLEKADGTMVIFEVQELPAGTAVMAFAADNTSAEENTVWQHAMVEASWTQVQRLLPEGIEAVADNGIITVTNNTGRNISEMTVYCHDLLDVEYFGGKVYVYTIKDLKANENTTIDAWDTLLAMADVVRITVK